MDTTKELPAPRALTGESSTQYKLEAKASYFRFEKYYAWVDDRKKQWDYTTHVDLTARRTNIDEANDRRLEDQGHYAEHFWRHLARREQARLIVYGVVEFKDMLIVDDKGGP
jgi:hypothetical protein